MTDTPNILSPSFPTGLPKMRSEAEVRAARGVDMLQVARAAIGVVAKPCPFCGENPGLARDLGPNRLNRFQVGCESDDCPVCPQTSGATLSEAWARWNKRAPQLSIVASNSDLELAGAGGIK